MSTHRIAIQKLNEEIAHWQRENESLGESLAKHRAREVGYEQMIAFGEQQIVALTAAIAALEAL